MPTPRGTYQGQPGPRGGTVFDPVSAAIGHGAPYHFSLGHCGLFSPVDVDGSFWEPVEVVREGQAIDARSDVEMMNATPGVIVVTGDDAEFQTESGAVVTLVRRPGSGEFAGCA